MVIAWRTMMRSSFFLCYWNKLNKQMADWQDSVSAIFGAWKSQAYCPFRICFGLISCFLLLGWPRFILIFSMTSLHHQIHLGRLFVITITNKVILKSENVLSLMAKLNMHELWDATINNSVWMFETLLPQNSIIV